MYTYMYMCVCLWANMCACVCFHPVVSYILCIGEMYIYIKDEDKCGNERSKHD